MRFLPLAGIALACATVSTATTLVAVWSPGQILLAADSSVTIDFAGTDVLGSACKIGELSSSYFAFSGLVEDTATGLHAETLAHRAMMQPGGIEDRLNRFLELAGDPLSRSVAQLRRDSPAQYEYLLHGHPVLQAIFAFVEAGPPSLAIAGFKLTPDGTLAPFAQVIAQGDDGRGPRIIYVGSQTHIREYLREHPDWYGDGARWELLQSLIELEVPGSGGAVGGPIDILKLTASGAEWVQRKSQCAAR